ncbi:MAG TPA: hypothetical protein PKZ54_07790 [Syntrophorhabdaceae bacterium]|nr:hypothetical protein [Syntrophorhabdaceae bacterium]
MAIFILELWIFNAGMAIMERHRENIKLFSHEAKKIIKMGEMDKVVVFRDIPSITFFI